jgi:hypothetical protein
MSSLVELLAKEPVRARVIESCVELIEAQVKQKGFIIKSAYATIKAIKKRFVPEVVDTMLDEWLGKLSPHFDRWSANKTSSFADYVIARGDDVAEDLLSVTDVRPDARRCEEERDRGGPGARADDREARAGRSEAARRHRLTGWRKTRCGLRSLCSGASLSLRFRFSCARAPCDPDSISFWLRLALGLLAAFFNGRGPACDHC